MAFQVILQDGETTDYDYTELAVTEVNRSDVRQFYVKESEWFIGVDVEDGLFNFNGLVVPFAFHSPTTELILFKRMRFNFTPSSGEQTEAEIHSICFGLRNTVPNPEGEIRNYVQLVWVNSDGTVTIGGNK